MLRLSALPKVTAAELAEMLMGAIPDDSDKPFDLPLQPIDLIVLQRVFNSLAFPDREILAMRHFERLSRHEIAAILEIKHVEVCHRYLFSLGRLKREFYSLNCLRSIPLRSYVHAQ